MIELNWFKAGEYWRALSPVLSLINAANMFWDVYSPTSGIWHVYLQGVRVWKPDGSHPLVFGGLHEAKCWVEDWEHRALQKKMETGTVPLLDLRE